MTARTLPADSRADASRPVQWERDMRKLPPFNKLVVAYLEGVKEHSDARWRRQGYAFMVRHDTAEFVEGPEQWATCFYNDALTKLGADELRVTAWLPLENPHGDC